MLGSTPISDQQLAQPLNKRLSQPLLLPPYAGAPVSTGGAEQRAVNNSYYSQLRSNGELSDQQSCEHSVHAHAVCIQGQSHACDCSIGDYMQDTALNSHACAQDFIHAIMYSSVYILKIIVNRQVNAKDPVCSFFFYSLVPL